VGIEKVKNELQVKGLNQTQIELIEKYLLIRGNNAEKIQQLKNILPNSAAQSGVQELQYVLAFFEKDNSKKAGYSGNIVLDFSLARGLNYYTGIIFEVRAKGVNIGSIGGGGRYDDLTGLFGVPGIPGVGISFGVDRIYDVMEELRLFPPAVQPSTQVLFFNLGEEAAFSCFDLMQEFRRAGIRCELYHEQARFDKQFKYAEKKNIPRVIIIGNDELQSGMAKLKDLGSGVQSEVPFGELISFFKAEGAKPNA
ncbi:MAG TPA: ATP phosphoribosyltransferase regulatory subunit, partial [Puia sp.]|nr:ATP phosphoribosyltransferase regulatory subunit [Puia sp.]